MYYYKLQKDGTAGVREMRTYHEAVIEAAKYLKSRMNKTPTIGLMTGTGLGESIAGIQTEMMMDYQEIPNFPATTVESHRGKLIVGRLEGKSVMAMQGRFHLYEGYSPLEVTFPIRVMQMLGVKVLILSNAAGGLNPTFNPGQMMIISDHLNLTGKNPLIGPNENSWGDRFPDMSRVYDRGLASLAKKQADRVGVQAANGIYAGLSGPSLETPAEVRYLRTIGADAVGFSTIQEVIVAIHAQMRVLGLSTITNVHNPDAPEPASVADIIACAEKAAPAIATIIGGVIGGIDAG
jgi:purine-nucleoside phosphorylase